MVSTTDTQTSPSMEECADAQHVDVAIIGAGAAGLEAAIVLGRQRRSTILIDSGKYRNAASHSAHMLLGQDGTPPAIIREKSLETIGALPSVHYVQAEVSKASTASDNAHIVLETTAGQQIVAQRLILAIGQRDHVEALPGLAESHGRYSFHCPYCHGWEARDRDIVVLCVPGAFPQRAAYQALYLKNRISARVRVIIPDAHNPEVIPPELLASLHAADIEITAATPAGINGTAGDVHIELKDADTMHCETLFAVPPASADTTLFEQLTIETRNGCAVINQQTRSSHPLVFVAGDAAVHHEEPEAMTFVAQAAAEGQRAAVWADQDLFMADLTAASSETATQ